MRKGDHTRERIVDQAFRLAGRDGLAGLTLSRLASALEMSKSGLFAHFRSKEELDLALLAGASEQFERQVAAPALRSRPGVARIKRLMDLWIAWIADPALPGGCVLLAATMELDDQEGPQRDYLVKMEQRMRSLLGRLAREAAGCGELAADLDPDQLAFELYGVALSYNLWKRLFRAERAEARAREAVRRLTTSPAS